MRAAAHPALTRTAVLVALYVAGSALAALDDSPDANIGLGLLLLAVPVLVAVVWAGVDGVRTGRLSRPLGPPALAWTLAAVATGVLEVVGLTVVAALSGGEPTAEVLLLGLTSFAPFVAVSIGVPALATLAVARAVSVPRAGATPAP